MGKSTLNSILVILNLFAPAWTQEGIMANVSVRQVTVNGGIPNGIRFPGREASLPVRACPTALFGFQPSGANSYQVPLNTIASTAAWGWSPLNAQVNYFTALTAGRSFTGPIRICRYDQTYNNPQGPFLYGVEEVVNQGLVCKALTTLPPPTPNYGVSISRSYSVYQVLSIPASLNVFWANQRSFPNFPSVNPAPLGFQTQNGTAYVARCKIVPDESYDPNYTITIPTLVFQNSFRGLLGVSYNGVDYQCDGEDLEFPVCV